MRSQEKDYSAGYQSRRDDKYYIQARGRSLFRSVNPFRPEGGNTWLYTAINAPQAKMKEFLYKDEPRTFSESIIDPVIESYYPHLQWEDEPFDIVSLPGGVEISSAQDLLDIAEYRDEFGEIYGNFIQTNDIDLSGHAPWPGIGHETWASFCGSYNGNGYKITGLHLENSGGWKGLFLWCEGATFVNMNIEGATGIFSSGYNCGFLSPRAYSMGSVKTRVENCKVSGNLTGRGSMGGFFGEGIGVDFIRCYADVNIVTRGISGLYAGYLQGHPDAGFGIRDTLFKCGAEGTITTESGYNKAYGIGGLVGQSTAQIEECFFKGSIISPGTRWEIGGLVGNNEGDIKNSYALVNMDLYLDSVSEHCIGLVVGIQTHGTMDKCYAKGNIETDGAEPGAVGGLVGLLWGGSVVNSYFDQDLHVFESDFGRSTQEMKTQSTYENWDFDTVWVMP